MPTAKPAAGPAIIVAAPATKGSADLKIDTELLGCPAGKGELYLLNGDVRDTRKSDRLSIELDTNEVAVWMP